MLGHAMDCNLQIAGVRLGQTNCYLVGSRGAYVLVDTGPPGKSGVLLRFMASRGIAPHEIKLIVITHTHYDHVGGAKALREACAAPLLVHEKEADILRRGEVVIPEGCTLFGKAASCAGKLLDRFLSFEAVAPDITVAGESSLSGYGVPAGIVPTPGHTAGSLSVVLGEGACIGDLMMLVGVPGIGGPLPFFGDDIPELYLSWERLLRRGVTTFYPGHGRPVSGAVARKYLPAVVPGADLEPGVEAPGG